MLVGVPSSGPRSAEDHAGGPAEPGIGPGRLWACALQEPGLSFLDKKEVGGLLPQWKHEAVAWSTPVSVALAWAATSPLVGSEEGPENCEEALPGPASSG